MPAFLKNSLFYFGENFDKYRKLEVGYKFFIADELREKGNLEYTKGNFAEALGFYEKAASIMRWLECTPDDFIANLKQFPQRMRNLSNHTDGVNSSTNSEPETEIRETPQPNTEAPPQKYEDRLSDLMLTSFTDDNVRVCEGPLSKENGDPDIHNNVLFGLYSNIAMCYLKMKNIKEARLTITEMEKISPKTSLFLFRKAQVISADLTSSLAELQTVRADLEAALEIKKNEKIYEHNPNFLKMFNLQNHETAFLDLKAFVHTRIKETRAAIKADIVKLMEKAKRIERNELDIISRGLVPEEGRERTLFLFQKDPSFETKLLKKLKEKYLQVVFFVAASKDSEDKDQLNYCLKAYEDVFRVLQKFKALWRLDLFGTNPVLRRIVEDANMQFKFAKKPETRRRADSQPA